MEIKKKIVELDLNDVLPNRFQPRLKFDESRLEELSHSIKQHGVIQPIIVRRLGNKFEIIAGERRYKASVMADAKTIPAIITEMNDKESSEIALIENVQRSDLTPIEEAISYKKVLDMNYFTQEELAARLGKKQSTVANKLRLLNLDDEVQEALLDMQISERHARSLLKLKDVDQQKSLLKRIIDERLTVRKTDEEIDNMLRDNEIEFLSFGAQEKSTNENLEMPSIDIIENHEAPQPDVSVPENDMLFNQANMDIPGLVGIDNIENNIDLNSPIPSVPIEEISEPVQEQTLNPGFMNIDDIENNAKDIFVEKPARPFTIEPVEAVPTVTESIPVVEEQKPSFININPNLIAEAEANAEVEKAEAYEEMPAQTSGNMFDFNFEEGFDMKKPEVKVPELAGLSNISSAGVSPQPITETVEAVQEVPTEEVVAGISHEQTPNGFPPIQELSANEGIEPSVVEENVTLEAIPVEDEVETLSLTGEIPVISAETVDNMVNEEFVLPELPVQNEAVATQEEGIIEMPSDLPPVEETLVEELPAVTNPAIMEDPKKDEKKGGFFSSLFGKKDDETAPVSPVVEEANSVLELPIEPVTEMPIIEEVIETPVKESVADEAITTTEATPVEDEVETLSLTGEMPVITSDIAFQVADEQVVNEDVIPVLEDTLTIEPISMESVDSLVENSIDVNLPVEETMDISPIVEELAANPEPTNVFENNGEAITEEPVFTVEETIAPVIEENYDAPVETLLDSVELPVEVSTEEQTAIEPIVEGVIEPLEQVPVVEETSEEDFSPVEIAELPTEEEESTGEDLTVSLMEQPLAETEVSKSFDEVLPAIAVAESLGNNSPKSMAAAMRIIRDCAEQLNQIGFITDTEEFDFEDVYQVIFKINKK